MKREMGMTGEASDHKVAGIFKDADKLNDCRQRLLETGGLKDSQILALAPGDQADGALLEPESRGIWHTLIRTHLWLALAGAVVGLVAFALLIWLDIAFVVGNPWAAAMLLVFFCTVGGAMVGGAVTLRPDHSPYIVKVKAALGDNHHVLIVHANDAQQLGKAHDCLKAFTEDTVSTL